MHSKSSLFKHHSETKIFIFSGKESTFYELDDVRHVAKKDPSDKNISMSEAITQTDWQMFDRMGGFSDDLAANPPGPGQGTGAGLVATGDYYSKTTPNGTSPCNHPSLSCQVSSHFQGLNKSLGWIIHT